MGIYYEIINCCKDLGQEYVGYLQTKDFDGCFDLFWISPDGCLFKVDFPIVRWYGAAAKESEPEHGRVTPFRFTGLVSISGKNCRRPIWFIRGRLVTNVTNCWLAP